MIPLLAIACATDAPPTGSPAPTADTADTASVDPCAIAAVHVGTGTLVDWHLVDDGDPVTVVYGPQGGWHVEVAGWVVGTGQVVGILPTLTVDGTALTGALPPVPRAMAASERCGWDFFGVRALLDDTVLPADAEAFVCDLHGRRASLAVAVTDDEEELELTGEVEVVLQRDPKQSCD